MNGIIQAAASKPANQQQKPSVQSVVNSMLDRDNLRKRFDELLGKRAPQFVSSLVSLVNASPNLQQAIFESPATVIQAALKAATYDLPIDPALGYAYIVPFRNNNKGVMEASFIMGYKGMNQLAMRTGAYKVINVEDVREGELKHWNRLTEEIDLEFIEDENEREALPVIGYVGYFRLLNGTEKTIYMTVKQIEAHEKKFRKGKDMGKGWRDDWDAMARKTVYRRLIGHWGLMSIDYHTADASTIAAAQAVATGQFDDQPIIELSGSEVNLSTGEVIESGETVEQ